MINKRIYFTCFTLLSLFVLFIGIKQGDAQTPIQTVKGTVVESGTGLPLKQVSISVASTGVLSETDEQGNFTIKVPDLKAELIIDLPGYSKRRIFINNREELKISLVQSDFKSLDKSYNQPLGSYVLKDATYALKSIEASDIKLTNSTSFDQALQGLVPGLSVVNQSGMPGHKTNLSIRNNTSIVAHNDPILFIDGMIYDYNYADKSLMQGHSLNPMDIVDIEDIADMTVLKGGTSYLGVANSNGLIYLNTEQKSEASTLIKISAYGGISFTPKNLDVLDATEFRQYLTERVSEEGADINTLFPDINSYRYTNSTDWQKEIYKPGMTQKFHIFLKGGDDIATYNISAGYLKQSGLYTKSSYNRFNLRINGKINITDKFSIMPNAKLSLADSYLPNQGYISQRNPMLSALLIPSIMTTNARDEETGETLPYLDDEGAFKVSNPMAIVQSAVGNSRNYHFLSSFNAQYKFNDNLILSNLMGINFNNARENIFIPNKGIVQIDAAVNSPGDFINEFRSTQNHTTLSYTNNSKNGHNFDAQAGVRYLVNSYKYNIAIDLNTASDDFRSLGQGTPPTGFGYLQSSDGDNRGLSWISYFGNVNYSIRGKYYLNANVSYDGNSANNEKNRYNLFPSVGGAWRISSEEFMNKSNFIDDLKLRASYSLTGNMYSSIYDYSKLYYTSQRLNATGVIVRESVPNENLEMEKNASINVGLDLSILKQTTNLHVDLYQTSVNNLIIAQRLPLSFGYTNFVDNGGKLANTGIEVALDTRKHFGDFVWNLGANFTQQFSEITGLDFIDKDMKSMVFNVFDAQYITSVGHAMNSFYGYETNGIFATEEEASAFIGPKGKRMKAGDIKFVDRDGDFVINENDKTIIGNPSPTIFGGLSTSLAYKAFEISANFNYCVGNDVFNYVRYKGESMDTYSNQLATVLDRWTATNTDATMPRGSIGDPTGNTVFSDRWIEDGSYLRLKQLTVSYNLPQSNLYSGVTLYLTASNLFTLTNYSGYDPEFYYQNTPFNAGIDYGKIPQARTIILGIKLDL
jgi:TonB-linked SusC/RagA family outer membrane protein